jgi:hypothetical protein
MQIVKILCDWCYDSKGEEVTSEKEVVLSINGKSIAADLCPDHVWAVENADMLLHMFKIGRRPDKAVVPVRTPRAKAPAPEPNEAGEYPCNLCDRSFNKPQGLGRHKLSVHGVAGASRQPSELVST